MLSNASHNVSAAEGLVENCYQTYVVRIPTKSYIINSVVGCVVNGILAVLGTFLNTLVVCVFWKTSSLRQNVSYFMIMVLSFIDLCTTVIVHPFYLVNSIAEVTETSKCFYKMFYQTSMVMLSGMSYLTFFVMNIERYLAIAYPFFHKVHVTKRRCLLFSFLLWLVCIATGIAPIFNLDIQLFVTALALIVLIGTLFIYISIYNIARKQKYLHREGTISQEDLAGTEPQGPQPARKAVSLRNDLVLAKMYFIVVACSFLLNLPNAIVLVLYTDRVKTLDGVVQMKIWTLTLVAMNSTANCLIFFWANKLLRNEGWKICKRLLNRWSWTQDHIDITMRKKRGFKPKYD